MKLENKIDCIYAAKNFSEYLDLKLPEPMTNGDIREDKAKAFGEMIKFAVKKPGEFISMWLYGTLTNLGETEGERRYKEESWKRSEEYNEKQDKYLESNGLVTLAQKASWYIAFNTGRDIRMRIYAERIRGRNKNSWLFKDDEGFGEFIGFGVREGERCGRNILRQLYLPPSKGRVEFNGEFGVLAVGWLSEEIVAKSDPIDELILLDAVKLKKTEEGFYLQTHFPKKDHLGEKI